MKLFALSDLHLSLTAPYQPGSSDAPCLAKPMEIFGELWQNCFERLTESWQSTVQPEDTVLIAGDLSWAMTLAEARHDLAYLAALPGKKLIIKGNHDYWWQSVSRVRENTHESLVFLQHSMAEAAGIAVCGTRGWLLPGARDYREADDRKIYERELLRLEMALREGEKSGLPLIAMLHYPPLDKDGEETGFSRLLSQYQVKTCIYGHLHGKQSPAFEGEKDGVFYRNCSIDRLDFCPLLLAENGVPLTFESPKKQENRGEERN